MSALAEDAVKFVIWLTNLSAVLWFSFWKAEGRQLLDVMSVLDLLLGEKFSTRDIIIAVSRKAYIL